jgi:hypothetical protein
MGSCVVQRECWENARPKISVGCTPVLTLLVHHGAKPGCQPAHLPTIVVSQSRMGMLRGPSRAADLLRRRGVAHATHVLGTLLPHTNQANMSSRWARPQSALHGVVCVSVCVCVCVCVCVLRCSNGTREARSTFGSHHARKVPSPNTAFVWRAFPGGDWNNCSRHRARRTDCVERILERVVLRVVTINYISESIHCLNATDARSVGFECAHWVSPGVDDLTVQPGVF